ncbi:50S ribosomal protein L24 [Candidatus Bathyarchaeota archaeon]|nr:50S ribosomal protein L24 [Candidatus Bathyarchaeota archaeon]
MKKNGVIKPSNARKKQNNASPHVKRKFISAPLSPSLKTQHGAKRLVVIEDDTIQIIKGDRKLAEGKVLRVNTKINSVYVEGLTKQRLDGTTIQIPIKASNIILTKIKTDDKWRKKILERKGFKTEKEA